MGQLRQAHCPVGTKPCLTLRWKRLAPLLIGFTFSAVAVFGLASIAGTVLRSTFSLKIDVVVAFVLSLCAATDLTFPRIRHSLFNRQTPKSLAGRFSAPITALLWGLDTGTVISTYRTSAASWAALTLTFAGWGPWWVGAAYATAFCLPLGLLIMTYPADGRDDGGSSWRRRSTGLLVPALLSPVKHVRYAAAVMALIGVVIVTEGAL